MWQRWIVHWGGPGVATPDATISDAVANNQNGVCTIQQWRDGHCATTRKIMDIPFTQLREFVYPPPHPRA
jgi:L-ascorbate oxidase